MTLKNYFLNSLVRFCKPDADRNAPLRGVGGLLIALAIALSGCISENYIIPPDPAPPIDGDERVMFIRLSQSPMARSSEGLAMAGHPVDFNRGSLFFVNSAGTILYHYTIGEGANNIVGDGRHINLDSLRRTEGVRINERSGNVRRAYLVGNTTGAPSFPAVTPGTTNISTVRNHLLRFYTQHDVHDVNVWGAADLEHRTGTSTTAGQRREYTVEIDLYPTVARIEIAGMTATGAITAFTLDGIFIDGFYEQSQLSGAIRTNIQNAADVDFTAARRGVFQPDASSAVHQFGINLTGNVGNEFTVRTPQQTGATAERGSVWGFQVFAQHDSITQQGFTPIHRTFQTVSGTSQTRTIYNEGSTLPRIVIRLSNVYVNGELWGDRYLTIGTFREYLPPHDVVTGLHASYVYHIPLHTFMFSERDLTEQPNQEPREVLVQIEMARWNGRRVTALDGFRQPDPISDNIDCNERHTFALGRAINNYNPDAPITYRWQMSTDGNRWTYVSEGSAANQGINAVVTNLRPGSNPRNFQTPRLISNMWFRRVAESQDASPSLDVIRIYSAPALVSTPCINRDFPEYVTIAGIQWATRNVNMPGSFSEHPGDPGMFFQWNRRTGWYIPNPPGNPPGWRAGDPIFTHDGINWEYRGWDNSIPPGDIGSTWEAANNPCPPGWQVPSAEHWERLRDSDVDVVFHTAQEAADLELGCYPGALVGNAPNQIFLPAPGIRALDYPLYGGVANDSERLQYWTGDAAGAPLSFNTARSMSISQRYPEIRVIGASTSGQDRAVAKPIRCVREVE